MLFCITNKIITQKYILTVIKAQMKSRFLQSKDTNCFQIHRSVLVVIITVKRFGGGSNQDSWHSEIRKECVFSIRFE